MAKTVKILLNIGTDDQKKFGLPEAYREGDVVSLEDKTAETFISHKWAVEYTDDVRKQDERLQKEAADAAVRAAMPLAAHEVAKEEAAKALKTGATPKKEIKDGTAAAVNTPAAEDFNKVKPVSSRDVK